MDLDETQKVVTVQGVGMATEGKTRVRTGQMAPGEETRVVEAILMMMVTRMTRKMMAPILARLDHVAVLTNKRTD